MFEIGTRLQERTFLTAFWHPIKLVLTAAFYHRIRGKDSRNHSSEHFHRN